MTPPCAGFLLRGDGPATVTAHGDTRKWRPCWPILITKHFLWAEWPLNNNGDESLLIDGGGVVRSRMVYGENDVRSGQWIHATKRPANTNPPNPGATRQK